MSEQLLPFINNRYQLKTEIGRGGMGSVYRAFDRLTQEIVALKQIAFPSKRVASNGDGSSNLTAYHIALTQEFKTLASLRHPNIISVLDYGFDEDGNPYFTMQMLEDADSILSAGRRKRLSEKVNLLMEILQSLAYLHRHGLLHRDLKPQNVLVDDGRVKVLDFGLSVRSNEGAQSEVAGTLAYMAPELLQGRAASVESDLYAVGVMAYQLFTNQHPFDGRSSGNLIANILNQQPDMDPLIGLALKDQTVVDPAQETEFGRRFETRLGDDEQITLRGPDYAQYETTIQASLLDADKVRLLESALNYAPQEVGVQSPSHDDTADQRSTEGLAQVIFKLLAKTPQERFGSAEEVITALADSMGIEAPKETKAIRESFLQAAKFVGRKDELTDLSNALEATLTGIGSTWLIGGESGVGKSRFLDELQTLALVKGAIVLRGQAVSEAGAPYQMWREVLKRLSLYTNLTDFEAGVLKPLVPDIDLLLGCPVSNASDIDPHAAQLRLLTVIEAIFLRQSKPVVILLEDIHWAQESLEILKRLNSIVSDRPLLIVSTYRDDERAELRYELASMRYLHLPRLAKVEIAELTSAMLGDVGQQESVLTLLQRETEGNAFFIVEIVRALADEAGQLARIGQMSLPESVFSGSIQAILRRRLRHIPATALTLLQVAAVAGRELDLKILTGTGLNQNLDRWLVDVSTVIEVQDNRYRFGHDKLREELLRTLPPDQAQIIHRTLAETIETVYLHDPVQYARLAYHWGACEALDKEAHYTQLTGELSIESGAFQEAIGAFQRSAKIAQQLGHPPEKQALLQYQLGNAFWSAGSTFDTISHLKTSLQLLGHPTPLTERVAIVRLGATFLRQLLHRLREDVFKRPFKGVKDENPLVLVGQASQLISMAYSVEDQAYRTFYHMIEALNAADIAGERSRNLSYTCNVGLSEAMQARSSMLSRLFASRASQLEKNITDKRTLGQALLFKAIFSGTRAEWGESTAYRESCLALAREIGDIRLWLIMSEIGLSYELYHDPDWDVLGEQVEAYAEEANHQNDHQSRAMATAWQIRFAMLRGDLDQALHIKLEKQEFLESFEDIGAQQHYLSAVVPLMLRRGELTAALELGDRLLKTIAPVPSHPEVLNALITLADLFCAQLERQDTPQNRQSVLAILKILSAYAGSYPIGKPVVALYKGLYYSLINKHQLAQTEMAQAIQQAVDFQMPYLTGIAHYYQACFCTNSVADRDAHANAAITIFKQLGEVWYLQKTIHFIKNER